MEVKQIEKAKNMLLHEMLGVQDTDCEMELDRGNSILRVIFDKRKLQAPQILSAVMSVMEVSDVQIQETELAEIVKEIYHHGMSDACGGK